MKIFSEANNRGNKLLDKVCDDSKSFLNIVQIKTIMKKYEICTYMIIIMFAIFSCKIDSSNRIASIVEEWNNKEILYPHQMTFTILGKDTIKTFPIQNSKYSIVTYVDSVGCMSCKLQLRKWLIFIEELDLRSNSSIPVFFFLHPKNVTEMIATLKRDQFGYPICIDEKDSLNILNHFPTDMSFQTFLLDQKNRVIAIGNPIFNPQIKKLYFSLLFDEHEIDTDSSSKTEVALSDSMIDMGNFSWREKKERTVLLKNMGDVPLVINSVTTSCGCTRIEYDKKPVSSGESICIKIIYKAEHPEHFNKTITIYCNAKNSPLRLRISGNAK